MNIIKSFSKFFFSSWFSSFLLCAGKWVFPTVLLREKLVWVSFIFSLINCSKRLNLKMMIQLNFCLLFPSDDF